jgi:hypothetical protein
MLWGGGGRAKFVGTNLNKINLTILELRDNRKNPLFRFHKSQGKNILNIKIALYTSKTFVSGIFRSNKYWARHARDALTLDATARIIPSL